jgi:putative ABC transport system permease protein
LCPRHDALVRLIVVQELRPVALGTLLGLVGGFWASRLLQRFLFEVSPLDPTAFVVASLTLVVVAVVGCYFPARRVTRIDPATALRAE